MADKRLPNSGPPRRRESTGEDGGGGAEGPPRERTPFPAAVYRYGRRPDPRFSLANERTLLAWIRTSLALLAGGVALEALHLPIQQHFRFAAATAFVVLGLLSAVQAWFGWVRAERALRQDRTLPAPTMGLVLVVGVSIVIVLLVLGFVW